MATYSGTGSHNSSYTGTLTLIEKNPDPVTNASDIDWELALTTGNYNFAQWGVTSVVQLNGDTEWDDYRQRSVSKNSTTIIASGTKSGVQHNDDGSLTISVYAKIQTAASQSYLPGLIEMSGTFTLTDIPRVSSLTAPSIDIGTAGTLTIKRAVSTFKDTVTWSCAGKSGTVVTKANNSQTTQGVSFTPPASGTNNLLPQLPTSTSATITYTVTTYLADGTTVVGTKTFTSTVKVASSVKPSISSVACVAVNTQTGLSGKAVFVAGYSKVKVTVSASAGSGSSITGYAISIDGQSGTTSPWTSDILTNTGTRTVKVTVTDARGRTATKDDTTISVVQYTIPTITALSAVRGTGTSASDWVNDDNGANIKVTVTSTISLTGSPVSNTQTVSVKCNNTTLTSTSATADYYFTATTTSSYTVEAWSTDALGITGATAKIIVPSISVPIFWKSDRLGFGKVGEYADMVDSAWDVEVEKAAASDTFVSVKNINGETKLRTSVSGVSGLFNQAFNNGAGKWIIRDDTDGHSLIPDHLLPTTEMSTASITLPSESGQVIRSHYNGTQVINIPDSTPSGWWCVVVRSRNQATNFVCGGSDGLVISGESSIPTSYSVSGLGTYLLVRIAGTRVALSIDAGTGGGGGGGTVAWSDITGKPSFAAVATTGDYDDLTDKPTLATVATTGDYDDLVDKPTIPTALSQLSDDTTHRVVTDTQISTWNGKSDFSGDYDDLTDKPDIPAQGQMWFGTSSTAQGTVKKTTTITGFPDTLTNGLLVAVRFSNANTSTSPTLSINSGTAVGIRRYGSTVAGTSAALSWQAGTVVLMCYYSSYWYIINWQNTTYSSMTTAEIDAGTGTSSRIITPANLKYAVQTWEHVNSVNGQTGAVTLTIPTVPTNVSSFNNDAGYLTLATLPVWDGSVT